MPTLLLEEDHFLKIVPVILDPDTPPAHQRAVADFFAHDVPDFPGWCARLRARIPGLYPAKVVWAQDQAGLLGRLRDADGVIVESLLIDRAALEDAGYSIRPRAPGFVGYSNYARVAGLKTLFGATLGIVGLGEVGREVARRAAAFGMTTLYFQRNRLPAAEEDALGAGHAALDDLMGRADYIVVQLPLNDSTRGIIGARALRGVKPGAFLVNCARAELIDRAALVEALDSGRLGGLGLDVGYDEPALPDDPLLKYRRSGRVVLMPHTAIAARDNALSDLERLCLSLWRGIVR
jgi:hypothetical protein